MMTLYDHIGRTYSGRRESDPQIALAVDGALGDCVSVLNVGAGTGSYEPRSRSVVAIEPSRTMISQRPPGSAPAVQAYAESLPFPDRSFDAVLGVLTVHHWKDQAKGFSECARVAKSRVVFFTHDVDVCARFWLFDYLPELAPHDQRIFPTLQRFKTAFGSIETIPVPIPADCRDGFLCAYWKRPRAYLDPLVRASISTFAKVGNIDCQLARLEADIDSGAWDSKYADLQSLDTLDLGYYLLVVPIHG